MYPWLHDFECLFSSYLKMLNVSLLALTRFGISMKNWSRQMFNNYFIYILMQGYVSSSYNSEQGTIVINRHLYKICTMIWTRFVIWFKICECLHMCVLCSYYWVLNRKQFSSFLLMVSCYMNSWCYVVWRRPPLR